MKRQASGTGGKATISDVARRARVSVGTVSHVLTGSAHVGDARRTRVDKAIEALGYVPNFHAQGLRRSLSRIVGICFPHVSTSYLNTLSQTLEEIASCNGHRVMHVFSRHDPATELDRMKELVRYRVDGLILLPSTAPRKALDFAHQKGVPLVVVDRPTEDPRFDHVILDNRAVMAELARRLAASGHTKLLFICVSRNRLVTQHRIDGLESARRAPAIPLAIEVIEFQNDEAFLRDELARSLRGPAPPDAVVVSNSHQASVVLGYLRALGVRCPDDVSVVTFDDPEWSKLVTPALAVVRQPAAAMAQAAWDLLMQRVNGVLGPPRTVALDAVIELRESVRDRHAIGLAARSVAGRTRPRKSAPTVPRVVGRPGARRSRLG